jgi:hypothetical protein
MEAKMIIPILSGIGFLIVVGIVWIRGIEGMRREYPHYRGEDLFDDDLK